MRKLQGLLCLMIVGTIISGFGSLFFSTVGRFVEAAEQSKKIVVKQVPPQPTEALEKDTIILLTLTDTTTTDVLLKKRGHVKRCESGKNSKTIRIFPAEQHYVDFFKSPVVVDSSVWEKHNGWPTPRQIKWLVEKTFGETVRVCCEGFGIGALIDIIIALFCHESSGSPFAASNICALGGTQVVFSTGVDMSKDKMVQIPYEYVDRTNTDHNILMCVRLFKRNMATFRSKGYENYVDWAILAHYTGSGDAEDTARYYGGLYKTPFYKSVKVYMDIKPATAPLWAQKLWSKNDWASIENIRCLAHGITRPVDQWNFVLGRSQSSRRSFKRIEATNKLPIRLEVVDGPGCYAAADNLSKDSSASAVVNQDSLDFSSIDLSPTQLASDE